MEVNLLEKFPSVKRNVQERVSQKTELERAIARQFDRDFFDGDRRHGYGGYYYHPRFWQGVAKDLQAYYNLRAGSRVLDVGCAKGFLLYDLLQLIPGMEIRGIDISYYAISQAPSEVRPYLQVADARALPFESGSFDLVISINTIHNFAGEELIQAIREIQRVSRGYSYVTVDAYQNQEEKQRLDDWVLTAKSVLHVSEWKDLFCKAGFTGDYYWFTL